MRMVKSPGMIVPLPSKTRQQLPKEIRLDDTEACMQVLRRELEDSLPMRRSFKSIADGTNMSVSTISRIFYRETRYPRSATIFTLLHYFGYVVYVRKEGNR